MKLVGVMMVRNEADVIGINLRHHFDQGVDEFLVVDNGSSRGLGIGWRCKVLSTPNGGRIAMRTSAWMCMALRIPLSATHGCATW